jgi:hypothetical protein
MKELKVSELVKIEGRTYRVMIRPPHRYLSLKRVPKKGESTQGLRNMEPPVGRLIDRLMMLIKEFGHITPEEAGIALGIPKQNCGQALRKLFNNWSAVEMRVEKHGHKNVPVYYLKNR